MPGALAAQLGFDSFDALLSSPADRPVLLVVDNCEHLLDAAAHWLVQILGACQQPTILATSRSPLELPGESVLSLAPLAVPGPERDPQSCPSVQLFLERCREAGAVVGQADLPAVVELCRRVDGLPLAIEIAAARARTMSIPEIVRRLDASVDVLDRPRFRGDPRHRSVADTIRWSYDLLSRRGGRLFEELAVFAGPFSGSTARAVAAVEDPDRFDALLDELTYASLVTVDTSGPQTRYRLLETVRQFALDRLRRRGALEPTYDRFADHVVAVGPGDRPGHHRELAAGAPPRPRRRLRRRGRSAALVHRPRHRPAAGVRPVRHPVGDRPPGPSRRHRRAGPPDARPLARPRIAGRRPVRGRPGDRGVRDGPSGAGPRAGGVHPGRASLARPGVGHAAPGGGSRPDGRLGDAEGALTAFRAGVAGGAGAGDAVDGDGARDRRRRGRRPTAASVEAGVAALGELVDRAAAVRLRHHRELGTHAVGAGCSCGSTRPPRCR